MLGWYTGLSKDERASASDPFKKEEQRRREGETLTAAKKLKQKAATAKKKQSARAEAALARLAELQAEYEDVFGEAPSGMYRNKIGWLEQQLKLRQADELRRDLEVAV